MNELARLKWQCRRGTKELDLLLMDYLENQYHKADAGQKKRFAELLNLEDADLLANLNLYSEFLTPNPKPIG
jgi:antitoxin CptB